MDADVPHPLSGRQTCFPFQSLTKQERTGIALALCGNVLISVSLNTQKYAHNMNEVDSGGARSYVELPMWWLGMILMTLGETGNFLAYAYAPATLVAPLGAITVISNCILAHYVLREEINRRNVLGVVLAIVGAVFIVTYAPVRTAPRPPKSPHALHHKPQTLNPKPWVLGFTTPQRVSLQRSTSPPPPS